MFVIISSLDMFVKETIKKIWHKMEWKREKKHFLCFFFILILIFFYIFCFCNELQWKKKIKIVVTLFRVIKHTNHEGAEWVGGEVRHMEDLILLNRLIRDALSLS